MAKTPLPKSSTRSRIILESSRNILDIVPKFHRFVITGNYTLAEIFERVPMLIAGDDKKYIPDKRMPNYKKKAHKTLPSGCRAIIFHAPIYPYLPRVLIELYYPNKEILKEIMRGLPGLKVSSVEYTIDLYCQNPSEVKKMFWVLYLLFPLKCPP